jgi:hypothetical protein
VVSFAVLSLAVVAACAGDDDTAETLDVTGSTVQSTTQTTGAESTAVASTQPPDTSEAPPITEAPEPTTAPETTKPAPTTIVVTTTQAPPTTPAPTLPSFAGGVQLVGQDIAPGRYIATDLGSFGCYWERLSGLGGTLDEIIANDNAEGQTIVEILPTDMAFNSDGCGTFTLYWPPTKPAKRFGPGDWAVGQQIEPGRYEAPGDPTGVGCYWERSSGFAHVLDEIIANDNVEGRAIVELAPGDARFTSRGCGKWTKLG